MDNVDNPVLAWSQRPGWVGKLLTGWVWLSRILRTGGCVRPGEEH